MRACVCVLPQPDSTAEAAFSQGKKKKEKLRSLSLVPLSVSLAPVVKRAGTVPPSVRASVRACDSSCLFPSLLHADHISALFWGVGAGGLLGAAVLMEFLVAVFSLSAGAGACFWNKKSVAVF